MMEVANPDEFTLEDLERGIEEDEEIDSDEFAGSDSEAADSDEEEAIATVRQRQRAKRQREEDDEDTSESDDQSESDEESISDDDDALSDGDGFQTLLDRLDRENEKSRAEMEEESATAVLGTDISGFTFLYRQQSNGPAELTNGLKQYQQEDKANYKIDPKNVAETEREKRQEAYKKANEQLSNWTHLVQKHRQTDDLNLLPAGPSKASLSTILPQANAGPQNDFEAMILQTLQAADEKEGAVLPDDIMSLEHLPAAQKRDLLFYDELKSKQRHRKRGKKRKQAKIVPIDAAASLEKRTRIRAKNTRAEVKRKMALRKQQENEEEEQSGNEEEQVEEHEGEEEETEAAGTVGDHLGLTKNLANLPFIQKYHAQQNQASANVDEEAEEEVMDTSIGGRRLFTSSEGAALPQQPKKTVLPDVINTDLTALPALLTRKKEQHDDFKGLSQSQRELAQRAFANDDVVEQMEQMQAEEDELSKDHKAEQKKALLAQGLPGWGAWGGAGVAERVPKKAPAPQVKEKKGNARVTINDKRCRKLTNRYLAAAAPFPYANPAEYEMTLRHPLGAEWNTQREHAKLVAKRVKTRAGMAIKPAGDGRYVGPTED